MPLYVIDAKEERYAVFDWLPQAADYLQCGRLPPGGASGTCLSIVPGRVGKTLQGEFLK